MFILHYYLVKPIILKDLYIILLRKIQLCINKMHYLITFSQIAIFIFSAFYLTIKKEMDEKKKGACGLERI